MESVSLEASRQLATHDVEARGSHTAHESSTEERDAPVAIAEQDAEATKSDTTKSDTEADVGARVDIDA